MTSNIGARFIQKKGTMGFQGSSDVSRTKMEEMVMNADVAPVKGLLDGG
jgi:ATP-dependent Clp protease ATP-binding subunit ClpA